jgi:CubicO group peptidase (beta-lactamase class C family)
MSAIDDKYAQLGGAGGFLGAPQGPETTCPDGVGRFRHYAGGSIYWTPETAAHEVHGAIREEWKSLGWELSWLGYPISDEQIGQTNRVSRFQNGRITWNQTDGAIDNSGIALIAYHGRTGDEHQERWDDLNPNGWRILSLSVYNGSGSPRYAAVWIKLPGPAQKAIHGTNALGYQIFFDQSVLFGFRPTIVTATGEGDDAVFAAVMEKRDGPVPLARHGLGHDPARIPKFGTFQYWNEWARLNHHILVSATIYGSKDKPLFAGIWAPNPDNVGWNADNVMTTSLDEQIRFGVQTAHFGRPYLSARSEYDRSVSVYRDDAVGPWTSHGELSSDDYQETWEQRRKEGFLSVSVQGGNDRYTAIFAKRVSPIPPRFVVKGSSAPGFQGLDEAIQGFMRLNNIKAGTVAVARGSRLGYARTFTFADPGYPIAQPTNIFRIGSCSKILTSTMIHQLIATTPLDATDLVHEVLELTPPPNKTMNATFKKIQIRHLLTHTSGVRAAFADLDVDVVKAFGKQLPASSMRDIARYLSTLPVTGTPGGQWEYANSGFLLLSAVVEHLTGKSWFATLKERVLDPLGLGRPRVSGSTLGSVAPNEVRYHDWGLNLYPSVMQADQPLVRDGYGNVNLAVGVGVGGMAFGAADFVKFLAAFAPGVTNPLMSNATAATMFSVPADLPVQGYTLGWGTGMLPGGITVFGHGGGLANAQALVNRRSDGVAYAAFFNKGGGYPCLPMPNWDDLIDAAPAWPAWDLFPGLGIPAFS